MITKPLHTFLLKHIDTTFDSIDRTLTTTADTKRTKGSYYVTRTAKPLRVASHECRKLQRTKDGEKMSSHFTSSPRSFNQQSSPTSLFSQRNYFSVFWDLLCKDSLEQKKRINKSLQFDVKNSLKRNVEWKKLFFSERD